MFNIVKKYDRKLVISGSIVESYNYKNPILYNYLINKNPLGRGSNKCTTDKEKNREDVLNRARRDIRRIINSNINMYANLTSKFVTFTFAENIQDLKIANIEWKKFIKRLKYYLNKDIKYLTVVEFQERGAVHYHSIFFNIPYISSNVLGRIWGNGYIKVNKIDNVDNVGAYICKYLTKQTSDRLKGKKSYFCSKGLYKPIEIVDEKKIDELEAHLLDKVTYEKVFENEYNTIIYKQYNIKKYK